MSLGTPHVGLSGNEWGDAIFRITEAFGVDQALALVQNLKGGMSTVMDTTHSFAMYVGSYSIDLAQFFESQKINLGPKLGTRWNEKVSLTTSIRKLRLNMS